MADVNNEIYLFGLTDEQVIESRERFGTNVLTPPKRPSLWKLYLEKFQDPVIKVLLIAALLSFIISILHNEFAETIGIFFAIFLATGISFFFEYDANRKFDLLNAVNEETLVKVLRSGKVHEIPRKDVVVGDVLFLDTGDEIPADGILIEAVSLQINESNLTGEPIVNKTINPEDFDEEATYPSNKVMRGTTVVDGRGKVKITEVGDETEIGKVARQATVETEEPTPLNIQLTKLATLIGTIGFSAAILAFVIFYVKDVIFGPFSFVGPKLVANGVLLALLVATIKMWFPRKYSGKLNKLPAWLWGIAGIFVGVGVIVIGFLLYKLNIQQEIDNWGGYLEVFQVVVKYFMMAVTLIVVAVPEGLPMSVTLSLALNMRRMLSTNNLVRKMHASETMGAITVICTDKTGTLTQNRMQVYQPVFYALGKEDNLKEDEVSQLIEEGVSVNSTAHLEETENNSWKGVGNPTEVALLLWLQKQNKSYIPLRKETKVIDQLTFSTERKFMATLVDSPLLQKRVLYLKGAPEIVLSKCKEVLLESRKVASSDSYQSIIEKQLLEFQNMAMRTLGFAYKIIENEAITDCEELVEKKDLTYLGLVAISDPIRPDVPDAVKKCQSAGIDVKIVTGDTPGTATEIARQIGLWTSADTDCNRMTGIEFEALSDEELLCRVENLKIMSRARPMDKQRLVQLLQQRGEVVAVTGDGTNDAPALNYANVGLSMGTGTSVAKEASDITLLDDSFNSISTAVMWGRSLYKNIQRFIVFQLTINLVALLIVLFGSLLGTELPLTVTQMLWVNLIMDTFAALALASIPPNECVMKEKPRKKTDFIINTAMRNNIFWMGLSFFIVLMGMLIYYYKSPDGVNTHNLTIFFTTFVMLQFWNLFNAKAFGTSESAFKDLLKSYGIVVVILAILIGQFLIVQFGGKVFRTEPLDGITWLKIILLTSIVVWIGEIVRFIKRLHENKHNTTCN